MNGILGLAKYITNITKKKENRQATRGILRGGRVWIGSQNYQYTSAVDLNVAEGEYVWCILTKENIAVIVGA